MAEFETINRGGHTYKRCKGSHDRWVDEKGNVVDLTNLKELATMRQKYNFKHGGSLYKKYFI